MNVLLCAFNDVSIVFKYAEICYALTTLRAPGGGGTTICGLYRYVPRGRVWFSSSLLWGRVYKSERLALE